MSIHNKIEEWVKGVQPDTGTKHPSADELRSLVDIFEYNQWRLAEYIVELTKDGAARVIRFTGLPDRGDLGYIDGDCVQIACTAAHALGIKYPRGQVEVHVGNDDKFFSQDGATHAFLKVTCEHGKAWMVDPSQKRLECWRESDYRSKGIYSRSNWYCGGDRVLLKQAPYPLAITENGDLIEFSVGESTGQHPDIGFFFGRKRPQEQTCDHYCTPHSYFEACIGDQVIAQRIRKFEMAILEKLKQ